MVAGKRFISPNGYRQDVGPKSLAPQINYKQVPYQGSEALMRNQFGIHSPGPMYDTRAVSPNGKGPLMGHKGAHCFDFFLIFFATNPLQHQLGHELRCHLFECFLGRADTMPSCKNVENLALK